MTAARNFFAAITWIAAIVATIGAAALSPDVFGIAGLIGALAALGWGLLTSISDGDDLDVIE